MERKRIAVFVKASIYNRKGLFNAFHNRVRYLKQIADFDVAPYIISSYIPDYICKIRGEKIKERPDNIKIDDIDYKILWYKNSLIDYILVHKLKRNAFFSKKSQSHFLHIFKDYNLIEAHTGSDIAFLINQKYAIPFVLTWHGTDIHTEPFKSEEAKQRTRMLIEKAEYNFFVSQALLETSNIFAPLGNKSVLYNGRDERFEEYSEDRKQKLRHIFNIDDKKVVTFVGNLIEVKNIRIIPSILSRIYEAKKNVEFWIIGDGPQKTYLVEAAKSLPIKLWGNQPSEKMPDFMNVSDVLILPSKNEGLPLVTVEAVSCGCSVVGSRVGGIAEVIGLENTIPLASENYIKLFSNRVLEFLNGKVKKQRLNEAFSWRITADKEYKLLKALLQK